MAERLRPRVEAITASLIRALPDEADLVSALAYPPPVMMISEMPGVPPEDRERFRAWSEKPARGLDPMLTEDLLSETGQARREFGACFSDLAARRRKRPGDDLPSELTRVRELTEPELLATCVLLLGGGGAPPRPAGAAHLPGRAGGRVAGRHARTGGHARDGRDRRGRSRPGDLPEPGRLAGPAPPYKENVVPRGLGALPVRLSGRG
nr:cytochrome P450 [Nonomuraea sp. ATCC 55076]